MDRLGHFWQLLWRGKWRPAMIVVAFVFIYDLIVAQRFPDSDWPTVSGWLPTWDWWAWIIIILVLVLIAVLEGSYKLNIKNPKAVSSKAIQKHEETISHLASLMREAEGLRVASANKQTPELNIICQEGITWAMKAIADISVRVGKTAEIKIRSELELPLEDEIREEDFYTQPAFTGYEHDFEFVRHRCNAVRNWMQKFIRDFPLNPDK